MTRCFIGILFLSHLGRVLYGATFPEGFPGSSSLSGVPVPGYADLMTYDGTAIGQINELKMALHPHIINSIQNLGMGGEGIDLAQARTLANASVKLYGPASPEMAHIRNAMHPQLMNAVQNLRSAGDVGTATAQINSLVEVGTTLYGSSVPASPRASSPQGGK